MVRGRLLEYSCHFEQINAPLVYVIQTLQTKGRERKRWLGHRPGSTGLQRRHWSCYNVHKKLHFSARTPHLHTHLHTHTHTHIKRSPNTADTTLNKYAKPKVKEIQRPPPHPIPPPPPPHTIFTVPSLPHSH